MELEILGLVICSLASPPGDSDACLFKNNCLRLVLLFQTPPNIVFSEGCSSDSKICPPATTSSNTWSLQQPPSSFLCFILVLLQSILPLVAKVILLSHKFVVCQQSVMSDSMTTWTVACQAPLSMECSRQEQWNGLPFPSSGDLPDPGIESGSPALLSESLPLSHQESHKFVSVILVLKTCRIFPSPFTHYPDFHLSYGPFQFWCPSSQLQSVQSNFFEF